MLIFLSWSYIAIGGPTTDSPPGPSFPSSGNNLPNSHFLLYVSLKLIIMVSFYVGDKTIAAAIGGTIGGVVAVVMVVGIIVVMAVLILIRGKFSHDYYHIAY